ncbi:MAG: tetratricopeptide repeat protein [Oscillospiraceae bacterium]
MSYEELSINGFIQEIKDVSDGHHPRKFCFVLGAGASISSGIKSGQELVDIWDDKLRIRNKSSYLKWRSEYGITDENKYSFYSQYYEHYYKRHPNDGYNFLEKLMENAIPSAGYVILSYLLSQTKNNVVITTNFDHLTEDAINYYTQTMPMVIGHESLSHYISKPINRPTVIKIHRDLLFDPANTVNEVDKLHDNWKKALDTILSEYHPIFIGYAGNDNSLMNYLIEQGEKFADDRLCCPYWMLYGNEKPVGKVHDFLEKSNGYFIHHNGFDEVMFLIGHVLEIKMQSKEDFLKKAENRFKILSDSIDNFTNKLMKDDSSSAADNSTVSEEIKEAVQYVTSQTDLQNMYKEVVLSYLKGNYEDAVSICKNLINLAPDNALYHNTFGIILHKMKRYDEALIEKQKAVELESDSAEYRNSLGITLHEMKRYYEALTETQKAVELEPNNAEYRNSLGITLHEMKRYDEALTETQKAVELEPNNAEYRNSLGITLHEMKRYDEALIEKQKAIELDPNDAFYHNNLGITLDYIERYDEAFIEKQKAVELEPDNAEYRNSLGITLHKMKRYDEALIEKQKAVELESDSAEYRNSLGITLHNMKRYDEALIEKQKAVALEPDNARYRNSLGVTLHELKRYDEALIEKQKAVELEPDNAEYHYSLGATLGCIERYDEALIETKKAVELEPDNPEYHDLLDIILSIIECYDEAPIPFNISDEMYNYGESTIKVIDDYIDNEIDYDSAAQKLDGIVSSIDYYESENEEEQKSSDFLIKADIIILKSKLFLEHLGKSTYSELLDSRNNLAKHLNINKRRKQ